MIAELISIQEDIRKLPDGWRWVKLEDVCEGKTSSFDPRSNPDKSFQYVDITSVDNVRKRIVKPKALLGKDAPSRARQIIRSGDVIVSTTRPNLNAVALVTPKFDNQICSTGFCVLRAKDILDKNYLFAFTQTTQFVNSLSSLVKGAMYPAVTDAQVLAQFIPLPPFSEQKRIAAILKEQMEAVERSRQATLAQLEAAKALPAAYLRVMFNSPEAYKWERKRLGNVCQIQLGKMLSPASKVGIRSRPYLRNANVRWNQFDLTDVYQMDFTEREEEKFELKPGDLLVCEGGEPGRSAVWHGQITPCFYQKTLHRLRPINGAVDTHFLMYWFWNSSLRRELIESHTKTTIAHLTAIVLNEILIGIPPIIEQQRIAATLTEQLAAVERLQKFLKSQLDAINKLPATLLRRAFNGEL